MDAIYGADRAEARSDEAEDKPKRERSECLAPAIGRDLVAVEQQRACSEAEACGNRDRALQRRRSPLGAVGALEWLRRDLLGLGEDCVRDLGLLGL
jgi:hypothetical protein